MKRGIFVFILAAITVFALASAAAASMEDWYSGLPESVSMLTNTRKQITVNLSKLPVSTDVTLSVSSTNASAVEAGADGDTIYLYGGRSGTSTITVELSSYAAESYSFHVNVYDNGSQPFSAPSELSVDTGETKQFLYSVLMLPDSYISVSTSDNTIATAETAGANKVNVRGVNEGEATVTVSVMNADNTVAIEKRISVTVNEQAALSIASEVSVVKGERNEVAIESNIPDGCRLTFSAGQCATVSLNENGKALFAGVKSGTETITFSIVDASDNVLVSKTVDVIVVDAFRLNNKNSITVSEEEWCAISGNIIANTDGKFNAYISESSPKGAVEIKSNEQSGSLVRVAIKGKKAGKATLTMTYENAEKIEIYRSAINVTVTSNKDKFALPSIFAASLIEPRLNGLNAVIALNSLNLLSDDGKRAAILQSGDMMYTTNGLNAVTFDGDERNYINVMTADGIAGNVNLGNVAVSGGPRGIAEITNPEGANLLANAKEGKGYVIGKAAKGDRFAVLATGDDFALVTDGNKSSYISNSDFSIINSVSEEDSQNGEDGEANATIQLNTQNEITVLVGEQKAIDMSAYSEATSASKMNWQSTNTKIATVSEDAVVTGIAIGTAYVFCSEDKKNSTLTTVRVIKTPDVPDWQDENTGYEKYICMSRTLNVRKGPGTSYSKLGLIYRNAILYGTKLEGKQWIRLKELWNGDIAYVSSTYMEKVIE